MLSFLRKYQRIFFVLIAIFVIVTFSFFGIERAVQDIRKVEDKDIGIAVNNSKIMLSDVENLSRFIFSDKNANYSSHDSPPNLFNDGVIKKDFISTGLALVLAEKYFDKIEIDLKNNYDKVQRYSPFTHYDIPTITATSVWEKFNPELIAKFKEIKNCNEINNNYFSSLIDLYQAEMRFPPEMLRRVLIYQERQYPNSPSDPRLYQNDLALFGFKNVYDWFGKNFVDGISQFIINVSILAKEKGYKVSYNEALSDLLKNLNLALKEQNINSDPSTYFKRQLQVLGLDEKSAVTTWQKVLLFRQYFSDITNNIFLDQHSMKEFSKFALEAAQIKLYSLPKSLKLESFEDLVQLQVYINATSQENDYQTIPNNFLSIEEIEKNYPELVYQNYLAEISQSTIEEVALQVSIKEMIKWQLEEKNWNLLSSKFSKLKKANSSETRYSQLEKLDKESKDKIDHFSRLQITNDNSTSIDKALDFSKPQQFVFQIRKKGTVLPFADLKDQNELIDLIKNNEEISKYSADNKTFYKIKIVEKQNDKHLLSYKNAKDDSTLKNLTARYLNEKYLQMRDKYPVRFKNADDSYKSFASVKNDVAKIHFSDLLNNIEKYFNKKVSDQNEYASLFLSMHMSDIKSKIQNNSLKVADMDHQWRVVAEDKEIIRSKEKDWIQDKLFTMNKDSFSSLNFSETNGPQFFYIASFNEKKPSAEKIEKSKEGIINESKCLLAKKLVKQFFDNNNIILPIRVEAN